MTFTRATAYVGLASVLVSWLAGAAGLSVTPRPPAPQPPRAEAATTQALADEIQGQASRLRDRLAAAPLPHEPIRNPFAFAARAVRPSRSSATAAAKPAAAEAVPTPEPPLQLVGVAERTTPAGIVRTALITADSDDLFMLIDGDTLGGRYRVKAVSADAVELLDLVTGATRRLALR
jgi:hypothetical protein